MVLPQDPSTDALLLFALHPQEAFVNPGVLRDDYAFSESGEYTSPPETDYDGYTNFIKGERD